MKRIVIGIEQAFALLLIMLRQTHAGDVEAIASGRASLLLCQEEGGTAAHTLVRKVRLLRNDYARRRRL